MLTEEQISRYGNFVAESYVARGTAREPVILELQGLLAELGFPMHVGVRASGQLIYSVRSAEDVALFQASEGLTVTGISDAGTWRSIIARVVNVRSGVPEASRCVDHDLLGMRMAASDPEFSARIALLHLCAAHHLAGVREHPMGSNLVAELEARAQGKPWCDFWVHDRVNRAIGRWLFGGYRGSTRKSWFMAKKHGLDRNDGPLPGDVGLVLGPEGKPVHTYVVTACDGAYVNTCEGNCSNRVARRTRPAPTAYYDPFDHSPETRARLWDKFPRVVQDERPARGDSTR